MYNRFNFFAVSLFLIIFVIVTFYGCVSSSNYYSGKTLEEGEHTINLYLDHVEFDKPDKTLGVARYLMFAPSIGVSFGLPARLEAILRYSPIYLFDVALREQLNPRDFEDFDISVNVDYGHFIKWYSYLKYGATLSKDFKGIEPYIHYNFYSFVGDKKDNSSDFVDNTADNFLDCNRIAGFGIGIRLGKKKILPEVDYQYMSNAPKDGWWRFGIGFNF